MPMMTEKDTQWVHEEDYGSFGLFDAIAGLFMIVFAIIGGIFSLFKRD